MSVSLIHMNFNLKVFPTKGSKTITFIFNKISARRLINQKIRYLKEIGFIAKRVLRTEKCYRKFSFLILVLTKSKSIQPQISEQFLREDHEGGQQ
jgi:hypothetical protein